jgi:hypothetical protein
MTSQESLIRRCIDITICSMAGVESERLCCGSALQNTHDEAEARAIAGWIVRSRSLAAIDAFIRFAAIEAAALVDANIGIVLSLARELLTHRTLDAAGIAEIIADADCRGSSSAAVTLIG